MFVKKSSLKEKISKLQSTINFFENLFDRLVKFIKNKMFGIKKMIKAKKKMITRLKCNHLCYFDRLDFLTCVDREVNTFICNCLPFNRSSWDIPIALAIS